MMRVIDCLIPAFFYLSASVVNTAMPLLIWPEALITGADYALSFSEPSTFYRAFKRWAGLTPAVFRNTCAH